MQASTKTIELNLTPTWIFNPFTSKPQLATAIKEFVLKINPLADFNDEIITEKSKFIVKRHEAINTQTNVHFILNLNEKVQKLLSCLLQEIQQLHNVFGKSVFFNYQDALKETEKALSDAFSKHPTTMQVFEGMQTCFNLAEKEIKESLLGDKGLNNKSLIATANRFKDPQKALWELFLKKLVEYFGAVPYEVFISSYRNKSVAVCDEASMINLLWNNFLQDHKAFENTVYNDIKNMLSTYYANGLFPGIEEEKVGGVQNLVSLFMIVMTTNYTELNKDKFKRTMNTLATVYNQFIVAYKDEFPILGQASDLIVQQQNNPAQRIPQQDTYLQFYVQEWHKNTNYYQNLYAIASLFLTFIFPSQGAEAYYSPHSRYMLKCIFRNLKNGETQFSNFQYLCCLENIIENIFESTQSAYIQVDPNITAIKTVQKSIRNTRVKALNEHVNYVNQVKSLPFSQNLAVPKKFFLETLSDFNKCSKSLIICVSGFTSEDCLKTEEWCKLQSVFPYTEILALNWNSSSATNVLTSAWQAVSSDENLFKNTGPGLLGKLVSGGIAAIKVANSVKDNVWGEAYKEATITGIYLAHLLATIEIFRGYSINLVGFSLGTLVITCCLQELAKMGRDDIIYDVLLMGGVANIKDYTDSVMAVIGNKLYNCYTSKDSVLKGAFKIAHPDIDPVGLNQVAGNVEKIVNTDVTEISPGHLEYRAALEKILSKIEFNEDFRYMLRK